MPAIELMTAIRPPPYLRKGLTYVLIFVWAAVFFHEQIQPKQIIGMAVIIVGMVVSMSDEH